MPASASAPRSSSGDVLHRGEELDVAGSRPARRAAAAISARTRSRFARTRAGVEAGAQARHATPAWRPVDAAVAAVGEEERGVGAHRAQPGVVDRGHAGRLQLRARDRLEVEAALARGGLVGREGRVDLLARPRSSSRARAGPDRRGHRPLAADLAQRAHALLEDAAGQPAPARRGASPPRRRRRGDRQAVGDEDERGRVGAARSPARPPPRPAGRRRAARWRAAPARRGPGGRRGSARAGRRRRRRAARGSRRRRAGRRRSGARGSARRTARPRRRRAGWRRGRGRPSSSPATWSPLPAERRRERRVGHRQDARWLIPRPRPRPRSRGINHPRRRAAVAASAAGWPEAPRLAATAVSAAASCASAVSARPSSIAARAAREPAHPPRGPCRPAASEVVAGDREPAMAALGEPCRDARPAAPGPSAAASAAASSGSRRSSASTPRTARGRVERRPEAPGDGRRRHDDRRLGRGERERPEPRGERRALRAAARRRPARRGRRGPPAGSRGRGRDQRRAGGEGRAQQRARRAPMRAPAPRAPRAAARARAGGARRPSRSPLTVAGAPAATASRARAPVCSSTAKPSRPA